MHSTFEVGFWYSSLDASPRSWTQGDDMSIFLKRKSKRLKSTTTPNKTLTIYFFCFAVKLLWSKLFAEGINVSLIVSQAEINSNLNPTQSYILALLHRMASTSSILCLWWTCRRANIANMKEKKKQTLKFTTKVPSIYRWVRQLVFSHRFKKTASPSYRLKRPQSHLIVFHWLTKKKRGSITGFKFHRSQSQDQISQR